MILEQMSARQVELLYKLEEIEYDGRVYEESEIEDHYFALIAEVADVFGTNDDGHLLDPRYGAPLNDLREIADLSDPPEDAGSIYDDELEALV